MIKYLFVLLTITQMSKCNQQHADKSKTELKIYYGTAQSWSGGAVGSGKGTHYLFYLSSADSSYSFDSVWVNGYRLALNKRNDYSSKDTLVLGASANFPGGRPGAPEGVVTEKKGPDKAAKPCCEESTFALRYIFNNNKIFLASSSLKILPKLNYP